MISTRKQCMMELNLYEIYKYRSDYRFASIIVVAGKRPVPLITQMTQSNLMVNDCICPQNTTYHPK